MTRFNLPRTRGPIRNGPRRLRDHLVAAMRREPIAYVGDVPEDDPDDLDNPRQPQQWAFLALIFILTAFTVMITVALGTPPPDSEVFMPGTPTATILTPEPPPPTPIACEAQPCINWSPHRLHCSSDPCKPTVTVRSEGTKVLRVTGLKFTGGAADRLEPEETCKGRSLRQGEACFITVRVKPGVAGRAQLRIQQNLPGPASLVDIEVDTWRPSPTPDLDLSLDGALECTVSPTEDSEGHVLTIDVPVRNSGPGRLSQQVSVSVSSDTGLEGEETADLITSSTRVPVTVNLPPDYGDEHRFIVTVDPAGEIAEQDESNNTLEAIVPLQDQPLTGAVKCRAL